MRRVGPHMLLLLLLLAPLPAVGAPRDSKVSGYMGWRYTDYQGDIGGAHAVDASSFSQQYSLGYSDAGNLNGGRGGVYAYTLGAEFTGVNNTIDGVDDALSTFKPLYNGQLVIAPGGLPFRLKLFCSDTHATSLVQDSNTQFASALFAPGIATDFVNGKHRTTGATLALGIKNGSYLGGYREMLSKWPRLLMDYKEVEVESFRSKAPQHYRQRNLAFVSLNKKDNWFHYRHLDFRDFLQRDGRGDYQTRSYIIGTIDPVLERAWINLTNWIKISAEGTFTQAQNAAIDARPEETYNLNLFAAATRDGIHSNFGSQFLRERGDDGLTRRLSVPVGVRQNLNRDTSWQLNASLDRFIDEQVRPTLSEEVFYLGLRVDAWRSRPYTLSPEAQLEVFDDSDGAGSALEFGVELASSSARQLRSSNHVGYFLRRFSGEGRSGASVDYLEQELILKHYRRSGSRAFGAEEFFQFGSGVIGGGFGHRIVPRTTAGQSFSRVNAADRDGHTLHSFTTFYGEAGVGRNVSSRLQLALDYLDSDSAGNLQWGVTHSLDANSRRALRYRMTNSAVFGGGQSASGGAVAGGSLTATSAATVERTFEHTSDLRYTPSRSLDGGVGLDLKYMQNGFNSLHYVGRQDCKYTYFKVNGVIRALFTLDEELSFEKVAVGGDAGQTLTELLLNANYFPTRHFNLGVSNRYTKDSTGIDSLVTTISAGMTYPLASVRLLYNQGRQTGNRDERRDRGFKVQVDKTF